MSERVVWSGRHVEVRDRDGWEYAARAGDRTAVVVLALDDGHVLLVEQHRRPLGARCLELPAGLVGDEEAGEPDETAAARELEEETGWRAGRLEPLGRFASAPGLASETFTLWRAMELERVGKGGGVAGEDIAVHRVPLDGLTAFIAERRAAGVVIDARLLALSICGAV